MRILSYLLYGLVAGLAIGYWFSPKIASKVSTQAESKIEYRIVTQEKIVERPGGIREVVRTITDNSTKQDKSKSETIKLKQPDWIVGLSGGIQRPTDFRPEYTLSVQRRVFGPAFAGLYGRTDGEFGISLSVQF